MIEKRHIQRPLGRTECHLTACSQFCRVLVGGASREVDFCTHSYRPLKTRRNKRCRKFTTKPVWKDGEEEGGES